MEPVSDRLAYIYSELSKDLAASADLGRAACWIVEQRYPDLTEAERTVLAEFADAAATRIRRAFDSITARPSSSRVGEGLERMAG
jgi:hypothetical protein